MMHAINAVIPALVSSLAASIVAKATLITTVALISAWLARGSRAAVRHAVLATSFAALLALPITSLLAPPVRIAVVQASPMQSRGAEGIDASQSNAPTDASSGITSSIPQRSLPPLDLLFAGWMVGAAFSLIRIINGLRQVHFLRQFGLPWRHGQSIVGRIALDDGIYRHIELLLHESLLAPVTYGVLHPAIVLPPDAQTWDGEDLNRAIIHEMEHVRRGDWVIHCLARVVCAAYWFHPLVWIAWRQLGLEAERCCDDAVLRRSDATAYADQLVELAQRLSSAGKSPALAMANRSDLSSRVRAVLDSRQERGRAGALLVTVACTVAMAVVLTMSPLRMVAAPQSAPAQTSGSLPSFDVASVKLNENPGRVPVRFGPDSLTLTSVDLRIAMILAYSIRDFQISGPDWLRDSAGAKRFDITAKSSHAVPEDQLRLMLRRLLIERFHLAIHWEKKEMPVIALLVAKNAPKLHLSDSGATVDSQWLGFSNVHFQIEREPDGRILRAFTNAPMAALAAALSANISGSLTSSDVVIDMTELPGRFDFVLRDMGPAVFGDPPTVDDKLAYYKRLVQDEFGLGLERRKAPVDVLVVDRADKVPTQN
jgi:uncharacterized protein (TIGR03435 family)